MDTARTSHNSRSSYLLPFIRVVCVENEQVLCNIDEVFLFFLFAIGDLFDLCLRAIVQRVHIQCKNICSHNVPYPFHPYPIFRQT